MKTKLTSIFLILILCLSVAACGQDEAQSVLEEVNEVVSGTSGKTDADDESEEFVVPDSVLNLSEEDDAKLTGTLTADSYANEYFGLRINKPEGGTIESILDDEGVTDIKSLRQTYEEEIGCIYIRAIDGDYNGVSAMISAVADDQKGKSEKDRAQERLDLEKSINESMEYESDLSIETLTIAGEEHPFFVESYDDEGTIKKSASACLLKNDFECALTISAPADKFDSMVSCIEKY